MNRKWNLGFGLVIVAALFVRISANADDTTKRCEKGKTCCPASAAQTVAEQPVCCAEGKACCPEGKACCADAKACCAEGKACCAEGKACCAEGKPCCAEGKPCCAEGKPCCAEGKPCCAEGTNKTACTQDSKSCCADGACTEKCSEKTAACENSCCKDNANDSSVAKIVTSVQSVLGGNTIPGKVITLLSDSNKGRPRFSVSLDFSLSSPKVETAACSDKPECQGATVCAEGDEPCVCQEDHALHVASCPGDVNEGTDELSCESLVSEVSDIERDILMPSSPPVPFAVSPLGVDVCPSNEGFVHTLDISPSVMKLVTENAQLRARLEMMERLFEMQRDMDGKLLEMAMENARLSTLLSQLSQSPSNANSSTVSTTASMPRCTTVALLQSNSRHSTPVTNCPAVPQVQLTGAQMDEDSSQSLQLPLRMKIDTNELVERVIQAVELKNKEASRK